MASLQLFERAIPRFNAAVNPVHIRVADSYRQLVIIEEGPCIRRLNQQSCGRRTGDSTTLNLLRRRWGMGTRLALLDREFEIEGTNGAK